MPCKHVAIVVGGFEGRGDGVLAQKVADCLGRLGVSVEIFRDKEGLAICNNQRPDFILYCCAYPELLALQTCQAPFLEIREYDFEGYCVFAPSHPVLRLGLGVFAKGILPPFQTYHSPVDALSAIQDPRLRQMIPFGEESDFLARHALFLGYTHYLSDLPVYFLLGAAYLERESRRPLVVVMPPFEDSFLVQVSAAKNCFQTLGIQTCVVESFNENGAWQSKTVFSGADGKCLRLITLITAVLDHERLTYAAYPFLLSTGDQHSGLCLHLGKPFLYELRLHKEAYFENIYAMYRQFAPQHTSLIDKLYHFIKGFSCKLVRRHASVSLSSLGGESLSEQPPVFSVRDPQLTLILDALDNVPAASVGRYLSEYNSGESSLLSFLHESLFGAEAEVHVS